MEVFRSDKFARIFIKSVIEKKKKFDSEKQKNYKNGKRLYRIIIKKYSVWKNT